MSFVVARLLPLSSCINSSVKDFQLISFLIPFDIFPPLSAFKECGAYFRQYLERHDYWKKLLDENPEITPYSLRHGYAWRGAKYYSRSIPLRDLSKLMGHSPKTHNKYYGIWTDNQDLIETVEKIAS